LKKLFVAGNWKLNKTQSEALAFFRSWWPLVQDSPNTLALFPSAILLSDVGQAITTAGARGRVHFGPQNIWPEAKGAFTGENSTDQALSLGCDIFLVGHSERRMIFGDTDQLVRKKTVYLLNKGLRTVLCVGETLDQRDSGQTLRVVLGQLEHALGDMKDLKNLVLAYEPVWAIGTGRVASPAQAEEVHQAIVGWLKQRGQGAVPVLYGGSVKSENAAELAACQNIHGFLVGGSSLEPQEFAKICNLRI